MVSNIYVYDMNSYLSTISALQGWLRGDGCETNLVWKQILPWAVNNLSTSPAQPQILPSWAYELYLYTLTAPNQPRTQLRSTHFPPHTCRDSCWRMASLPASRAASSATRLFSADALSSASVWTEEHRPKEDQARWRDGGGGK